LTRQTAYTYTYRYRYRCTCARVGQHKIVAGMFQFDKSAHTHTSMHIWIMHTHVCTCMKWSILSVMPQLHMWAQMHAKTCTKCSIHASAQLHHFFESFICLWEGWYCALVHGHPAMSLAWSNGIHMHILIISVLE
jgi:hypothetical protein